MSDFKKVIKAEEEWTVTGKDRWSLALECGHTVWRPRTQGKAAPGRIKCPECPECPERRTSRGIGVAAAAMLAVLLAACASSAGSPVLCEDYNLLLLDDSTIDFEQAVPLVEIEALAAIGGVELQIAVDSPPGVLVGYQTLPPSLAAGQRVPLATITPIDPPTFWEFYVGARVGVGAEDIDWSTRLIANDDIEISYSSHCGR